jgi:hypothetical protein
MAQVSNLLDKRVMDSCAFVAGISTNAATGAYSWVQAINPAASGKLALIRRIAAAPGALSYVFVRINAGALGGTTLAGASLSKIIGEASTSVMVMNNGATASAPTGTLVLQCLGNAQTQEMLGSSPLVLLPGRGVVITAGNTNVALATTIEWEELDA